METQFEWWFHHTQEGVSLSYNDELIRLRKYAYGSCEMVFNKLKDWPRQGVISSLYWCERPETALRNLMLIKQSIT